MNEQRLIDANALKYKNLAEVNGRLTYVLTAEEIDNAPTITQDCSECKPIVPPVDLDREIKLYKAKVDFYKSRKIQEYDDTARELNFVVELLEKLRSERPKSEWINHRNDNGHNIADCSLCGKAMQWHDEDEDGIPRYCWYCGAPMKGGAE